MLANQLIQRFNPSIKQLLFISAALGIAVCVILGTKQIINMNENVTRYQQNEVVVNIMSVLDNVAHQHALERGLSAGFVGSGNKAVFKRLEAQRKLADESVLNLERFLLTVDKSKLNLSFIDMLYGRLSKKSMIRQQVDARNGSQFFIYYSSINRKVMSFNNIIRGYIGSNQQQQSIQQALLLSELKERLGQARGKLNGVLASGKIEPQAKQELTYYIEEINELGQIIQFMFTPEQKAVLNPKLQHANFDQIDSVFAYILNHPIGMLDKPPLNANAWFALATSKIQAVNQVLNTKWDNNINLAQTQSSNSITWAATLMILIICALIILLLLNSVTASIISKHLQSITHDLGYLNKGDFSRGIQIEGSNEFTRIQMALCETFQKIRSAMLVVQSNALDTADVSQHVETASSEVYEKSIASKNATEIIQQEVADINDATAMLMKNAEDAQTVSINLTDKIIKTTHSTNVTVRPLHLLFNYP